MNASLKLSVIYFEEELDRQMNASLHVCLRLNVSMGPLYLLVPNFGTIRNGEMWLSQTILKIKKINTLLQKKKKKLTDYHRLLPFLNKTQNLLA